MVVICTKGFPVKDVKFLVRKWFLKRYDQKNVAGDKSRNGYLARVTIEAFFVVFPLQLTVSRGYCLFFDRQITASTL